jgi:hypothetical protein
MNRVHQIVLLCQPRSWRIDQRRDCYTRHPVNAINGCNMLYGEITDDHCSTWFEPTHTKPDRPGTVSRGLKARCGICYLTSSAIPTFRLQVSQTFAGVDTTPEKKDGSEHQDPGVGGFRFTRDFVARQSWRDVEDGGLP